MTGNKWTEEEMQILVDNYLFMTDKELSELIPNHSAGSINSTRNKLGLKKGHYTRSFDDVVNYLNQMGYDMLSSPSEYQDTQSKVRINCPKHGEQSIRVNHIFEGKCCSACGYELSGMKRRRNDCDIVELYKKHCEEHNLTFIGVRREYINKRARLWVSYICDVHKDLGIKEVRGDSLLKSQGCLQCAKEKIGLHLLLSDDAVIGKVRQKNPNLEIVGEYKGVGKPLAVKCLKCGSVWDAHVYTYMKCPMCDHFYMGEKMTAECLDDSNIEYITQYKFEDCVFRQPLKFDFYLPVRNICIEYNGVQHYQPCDIFGGQEQFEEQQIRDNIKRQYCKDKGIKLIEIPHIYNTKEKIDNFLKENL